MASKTIRRTIELDLRTWERFIDFNKIKDLDYVSSMTVALNEWMNKKN